jgi:hypothetical protein
MPIRRNRDGPLIGAVSLLFFLLYFLGTTRNYTHAADSLPVAFVVHENPGVIVHHPVLLALHWLNRVLGFPGPEDLPKSIQLF